MKALFKSKKRGDKCVMIRRGEAIETIVTKVGRDYIYCQHEGSRCAIKFRMLDGCSTVFYYEAQLYPSDNYLSEIELNKRIRKEIVGMLGNASLDDLRKIYKILNN